MYRCATRVDRSLVPAINARDREEGMDCNGIRSGLAKNELAMDVPDLGVEAGRILRFGLIGICATLVYALTAAMAIEILSISPIPSSILGQAVSAVVSYLGHSIFTFRVKTDHRAFLWRFMIIAGLTLATNVTVTWLLTDILRLSHRVMIAVVSILIPTINYVCNRFWVFKPGLAAAQIHVPTAQPAKFDINQT
jgi:putative flippase GtrA